MRVRKLTARNDTFRSAKGRDSAPRRYVVSGTDSPLPFEERGQGEGFAGCAANVGEPLTSILSPSAKGEAAAAAQCGKSTFIKNSSANPYRRTNARLVFRSR